MTMMRMTTKQTPERIVSPRLILAFLLALSPLGLERAFRKDTEKGLYNNIWKYYYIHNIHIGFQELKLVKLYPLYTIKTGPYTYYSDFLHVVYTVYTNTYLLPMKRRCSLVLNFLCMYILILVQFCMYLVDFMTRYVWFL